MNKSKGEKSMEYGAKSIQQLTFREGVQKRVGIYLGSAENRGRIR